MVDIEQLKNLSKSKTFVRERKEKGEKGGEREKKIRFPRKFGKRIGMKTL